MIDDLKARSSHAVARAKVLLSGRSSRGSRLLVLFLILGSPAWVYWDSFDCFRIRGDDYYYLRDSSSLPQLQTSFWKPHNSHVVPMFRLWTFAVFKASPNWTSLPTVMMLSCLLALTTLMMSLALLIRLATGSETLALVAAATMGCSTVPYTAITWYCASQTLLAGTGVVLTLFFLVLWRQNCRLLWMVVAVLANLAAYGFWSVGAIAAPVGAAYLWQQGKRMAALGFLVTVLAIIAIVLGLKSVEVFKQVNFGDRTMTEAMSPLVGVVHTIHAIPEILILGNLGVEARLTRVQGFTFCCGFGLLWLWTAYASGRLSPLELVGGLLVIFGFMMPYTARGYLTSLESFRTLRWYNTLPQVGAVLVAVGWMGRQLAGKLVAGAPKELDRPDEQNRGDRHSLSNASWSRQSPPGAARLELVLLLIGTIAFAVLHKSRESTLLLQEIAPGSAGEIRRHFLSDARTRTATRLLAHEVQHTQREFLTQLENIERTAAEAALGQLSLTSAYGPLTGPYVPESFDMFTLLSLPEEKEAVAASRVRDRFDSTLEDRYPRNPEREALRSLQLFGDVGLE